MKQHGMVRFSSFSISQEEEQIAVVIVVVVVVVFDEVVAAFVADIAVGVAAV